MPIIKAAKKALRQNRKRRIKNAKKIKHLRILLKESRNLISQKKTDEAKSLLPKVYKALDKAAKKGLIKKNQASRKKSRITRAIYKAR